MSNKPIILIVEDHQDTREMLTIALEADGFEVVAASDGVKLLPLIREHLPSLILLDIMMPWVDGYDLCRAIKENADLSKIPIFFLSAKINPEDIETGIDAGADEYITKPVNLTLLSEKIREYIPSV